MKRVMNFDWKNLRVGEVADDEVLRQIKSVPVHFAALQFGVPFETIANSSTAKTNILVKAPANQAVKILGLYIGFDGTNSANGPAIVEVGSCTMATGVINTNNTAVTPVAYDSGRPETIQSTAGKNWTTEPTVISVQEAFNIPTYMGSGLVYRPLTVPIVVRGGYGCAVRITLPASVTANATGTLVCEE